MWKALIIVGVLAVVGVLGAGGYVVAATPIGEGIRKSFKREPPAVEVRLHHAARGGLVRTVSAPGTIEPRTKVEISAQVSSRVVALPFRAGQRVRQGDVVVRLDARDLMARLEAAKARLAAQEARLRGAEATLAVARSEFNRRKELFESGDVSRSELERSENDYLQAVSAAEMVRAEIDTARAQIIEAEKDLENSVIESPIDGVVTKLNAEVGELVVIGTLNNPGSVIMEIADLSDMLLHARVDESNIADVSAGQEAAIHVNAYRETPFRGVVERVDLVRQTWRDGTNYFLVEIVVDAAAAGRELLSGMNATCEIEVQELTGVLVVPSQAVLDRRVDELPKALVESSPQIDPRKTFARVVFVFEEGKAIARPVQVGPSDLTDTVILSGLRESDRVITGPYKSLINLKHEGLVKEEGTGTGATKAAESAEPVADSSE